MSVRDHVIYEIEVSYTQTIQQRDSDDNVYGTIVTPNVRVTHRVIAPKYEPGEMIAKTFVESRYRFSGGCQIISCKSHEISGFIEQHTY